ncbi:PilZ domain-containing protein [Malikia sp.]|uniref:flagellar brake protein n=1 Tax=Malikia sp. TaxID=2070706 RepID=UPI002616D352|nr:PilZ domain-containing protein [Malikia sp.]MDD2729857.1 PilZ domain-containing protein [Malikia sp.]
MTHTSLLPPAGDPFWIDSPLEIRQIMRDLARRGPIVQCWGSLLAEPVTATILEVRESDDMVLRFAAGPLLRAGQSVAVLANLRSARTCFLVENLRPDDSGEALAHAARLPLRVHRLQRREFFRVPSPASLLCELPLRRAMTDEGAAKFGRLMLRLIDISAGGVCLALPAGTRLPLERETVLQGCSLELPGFGLIRFGLQLLSRLEAEEKSGEQLLGARFVEMDPLDQMLLQRFLYQLQISACD